MNQSVLPTVGIAGVGRMGGAALQALAARGITVVVYDHDPDARARAESLGASSVLSAADLWGVAPTVLLSLPDDNALRDITGSLPGRLSRDVTILDLSTVSIGASLAAGDSAAVAGASYVDCPVIGGVTNAGSWTLLVGAGELPSEASEILSALGRVELTGARGNGLRLKLLNNMLLVLHAAAVCEAVILSRSAGLNPGAMQRVLLSANSVALSRLFAEVLPRALEPAARERPANVFPTALLLKDARMALELGASLGVSLPAVGAAYAELEEFGRGLESSDFTRIFARLALG